MSRGLNFRAAWLTLRGAAPPRRSWPCPGGTIVVNLDLRTRSDADVRPLDFVSFHEDALPRLLRSATAELAAHGVELLGLRPLALAVDGSAYTYAVAGGKLEVRPGEDGAEAVAELTPQAFADLMQDLRSTIGLLISDDVRMRRGSQRSFVDWEPVLRAMLDGRPVYQPGSIDLRDRDGSPLRLQRTFRLGDAPAEMAHFLGAAGFLHIAGMFTADEMAALGADIDRAAPLYAPDDGRSWWARTRAGEHRPVRLQYFQEHSAATRALLDDPRLLAIADLTTNRHRAARRGENAIEALIKPIGVVEGISDVSWHKDCSLGRHSYQCCGITVGISVTDSDAASGQLCVVAGSHRANVPLRGLRDDLDLPRVGLPTRAGDVTVHLSCTLHMSIPPTARERRVMYTGLALPPRAGDSRPAYDALRAVREQAPRKVAALAGTSISDDPEMERVNRFDTRGVRSTR